MKLEAKIFELKQIAEQYESKEFLTFLGGLILMIPKRNEHLFLKDLMSPMMQLFFLALLNLQGEGTGTKKGIQLNEWKPIATLLHEIELEYFYKLGWPKEGEETKEDIKKIMVSMPTFFHYFFNGPLSYSEQEIERIEKIFKPLEDEIEKHSGLQLKDFIAFYELLSETLNAKTNYIISGMVERGGFKFVSDAYEKGLTRDTLTEPIPEVITDFFNYLSNPGIPLIFDLDAIEYSKIERRKIEKILNILTFTPVPKSGITYYTDDNPFLQQPFIKTGNVEYLNFFPKQYLNAVYSYLWKLCNTINKTRILKLRDVFLETKATEIFTTFLGDKVHVYQNYGINDNTYEQDILILYKGLALIIEAKATSYRPPMRDPIKAFDKVKSDFKANIQYAYDQTWRVKKKFLFKEDFEIVDVKGKVLYKVPVRKYPNVYSVVVTWERFGMIQCDLGQLLSIDEIDEYPWAINVDDLEAFLLTMKKHGHNQQGLITFLEHRQYFHEHILCGDEIELCGIFLNDKEEFKKLSEIDAMVVTKPADTEPIESMYRKGMGFKNERFMKQKQDGAVFLFSK